MSKKMKVIVLFLLLCFLILAGCVYVYYPLDLTSEEIAGLQEFYKLNDEECDKLEEMKSAGLVDGQDNAFMTEWEQLTSLEHQVNYKYMQLNERQKRYARFHSDLDRLLNSDPVMR